MNTFLWIVAIVLAVAMLGSGLMKLVQPKEKLAASGMKWTDDYSANTIRLIAAAEVLGAIGLVLPAALDIAPILVPIAALGLAIIMAGAVVVHARRKEYPAMVPSAVLLVLAVIVAWGRFGPYSF
jgi:uncharacterized membrane protein YphA (DoxX/SURF4 family)